MAIDLLFHFIWRWLLLFFLLSLAMLLIYQLLAWLRNSKGQSNRKALMQMFAVEGSYENSVLYNNFNLIQTTPWLDHRFKSLAWLCPQWSTQLIASPSLQQLRECITNHLNNTQSVDANWPPELNTKYHALAITKTKTEENEIDKVLQENWQVTKKIQTLLLCIVLAVSINIDAIKISKNLWSQTMSCYSQLQCQPASESFSEAIDSVGIGWPTQSSNYYLQALIWPEPMQNAKSWLNDKLCGCQAEQAALDEAPPSQHAGWFIAAVLIWLLALAINRPVSYLYNTLLKK